MDRLPLVIAACLLAFAGCDNDGKTDDGPARQRVNAVKAGAEKAPDLEAFCDVYSPGAEAPAFVMPDLAEGETRPPDPRGWRWLNLWATWCKPCIEEIPRMQAWLPRLRAAGADVTLHLVSVDAEAADVAAYEKDHPEVADSVRIVTPDLIGPWLANFGIDNFASIPVHVFADAGGAVRCVRLAGVKDADYAAVEALLAGR
jgi:thiol-disulfide isomerase/thioredoxin